MKKRGFTLIELLAVVIVISVIAVITTPLVLGAIEKSKKGSALSSALGYIKSVEMLSMQNKINNNKLVSGENINILKEEGYNNITVKGTKPSKGYITITDNGKIESANLCVNEYEVSYDGHKAEILGSDCSNLHVVYKPYAPELQGKMVPITLESDGTVRKADTSSEWYNYAEKKWANAVILNVDDTYSNGDEIALSDIKAYYVWIPRYEYKMEKISNVDLLNPPPIDIRFIDIDGESAKDYIIHPAFTFGSDEVKGIWIGKFEISGSITEATESSVIADLKVLPNVKQLRKITLSQYFYSMLALKDNYEVTDTHMIKNSEWGAAAYLTHSIYGRCTADSCVEIGTNNNLNHLTGYGAPATSNENDETGAYNTALGQNATTTGNIYGIYDMAGGVAEFVMGNLNNIVGSSGFTDLSSIDSKYINIYTGTSMSNACNSGICYGHALSETKGYYEDYSTYVKELDPWFTRGGGYFHDEGIGIFCFISDTGDLDNNLSSRAVVITR